MTVHVSVRILVSSAVPEKHHSEKYRTTTLSSLKSSWENKTNTPEAMKSGRNRVKTELGIQTPDTLETPRSTHFISCKAESDRETLAWDPRRTFRQTPGTVPGQGRAAGEMKVSKAPHPVNMETEIITSKDARSGCFREEEMLESAFLEDQKEMEEGQDILTRAMTWRGTEGKHPGGENPDEGD